jgi:23S rRNA pseudouridine1911/1915/1917 synthase
VQDFLEEKFKQNSAWLTADKESDFYQRAGFVHRIDKETSGILVVAKNPESFQDLQAQFKERKVNKTYVALVHGHIDAGDGEISVPVGRLPWNRKRFGVLAGGKEATTYYKVIKTFEKPFTLLELNPKTGRTHQIRVHLKYFNHPIFGDELYAGRKVSRDDRKILDRFFLHAQKIFLYHPKTGDRVEFESPLPTELANIISIMEH